MSAAVSALAPNTRKAYGSAWSAWQRWALDQGRPVLPGTAADVADYLEARHAAGASPATIRLARAAVAKVHQVSGAADPTADGLVTDVLKRIGRDGRDRGRGQVAGIGWSAAEAAASIAANGGDSLAGLRDAALLRVMSDGLLRISEASALQVSDVEATADGGTVTIRASKTDQQGDGAVRFLGVPTVAAVQRYLEAAGITSGPPTGDQLAQSRVAGIGHQVGQAAVVHHRHIPGAAQVGHVAHRAAGPAVAVDPAVQRPLRDRQGARGPAHRRPGRRQQQRECGGAQPFTGGRQPERMPAEHRAGMLRTAAFFVLEVRPQLGARFPDVTVNAVPG